MRVWSKKLVGDKMWMMTISMIASSLGMGGLHKTRSYAGAWEREKEMPKT